MNKLKTLILVSAVALFASCETIKPGNDPVVVRAEQVEALAKSTFTLIEQADYDGYATLKAVDPATAAAERTFVNSIRVNEKAWLTSAQTMKKAYKANRTADNKASLETALSVLNAAIATANQYLAKLPTPAKP